MREISPDAIQRAHDADGSRPNATVAVSRASNFLIRFLLQIDSGYSYSWPYRPKTLATGYCATEQKMVHAASFLDSKEVHVHLPLYKGRFFHRYLNFHELK